MADERWSEFIEESPKSWVQGLFEESRTEKQKLGTVRKLSDGRVFVYAKAGADNLAVGKLTQAPVQVANHLDIAVAVTAAIGARQVTVTLGATLATKDQYKDGFLYVNNETGEGHAYKIKSHPAADSGGSLVVTLYDKIRVGLVAGTSKVTLFACPFNGVIIHPSPPTAGLTGIPQTAVTAAYYYWSLVKGITPCLIDGTPAINQNIKPSGAVDGAVCVAVEAEILYDAIGFVLNTGVDTEYRVIMLDTPGY